MLSKEETCPLGGEGPLARNLLCFLADGVLLLLMCLKLEIRALMKMTPSKFEVVKKRSGCELVNNGAFILDVIDRHVNVLFRSIPSQSLDRHTL